MASANVVAVPVAFTVGQEIRIDKHSSNRDGKNRRNKRSVVGPGTPNARSGMNQFKEAWDGLLREF